MYLKKAQSKKPCLYEIPYEKSDPANRLVPDREETLTLEKESQSKLNKDKVRPYDYTKLNSLYEIFKPATQEYHEQLAYSNEYVESLENEIDELKSDKAEFSNMYDILLQECVSNDVMCSYLHSLSDLDAHTKLQCLYLHKVKEYLKAQLQDKNIAISELKKLIEKFKGKSVDTKFDKPSVVRQPNAQRIPKPSVLSKPTPFSDSLERNRVIHRTNVSRPQLRSTQMKDKIVQLILFIVDTGCTKHMTGNLKLLCNFVEKYIGTIRFGNDQFAPILGYRDLVHRNIMIKRKSTCFVRDLQGNDLLTGNRVSDIYIISLQETTSSTPIYFMAKASPTQAWLWHRRLSHLNFDYINLLSKKDVMIGLPKLKYVKDQLCSSCEVSKAKRSSFKTKAISSSKGRLNLLHIDLCGPIRVASINRKKYILAEAIATACYTQNRSIIIPTYEKTAYHIINDRKPSIKHLHIFGCTCYLTRDGKNLDKMKEKGDPCILVGYSTQSKGYHIYNKRTRLIVESIHHRFDEIKEMSETSVDNDTLGLIPQRQKASDYDKSGPLDLLFGPPYDEFFNAGTSSVNNSSSPTENSKQQDTPPIMNTQPSTAPTTPTTHVNAKENNDNQAEDTQFQQDEFINPFCTPVREVVESSSRNIDNSNMHTFYQLHDSEYRWTKDHPLEQVRGNPSKLVQTRRQLATDPEMCMFMLTVSTIEPKNIKEAMADSAWIEAMHEELHQFDRL
ncbi:retrovirus-related pol polyprotein from transposon TNT 1-94 [Tanacetum coccineum]